MIEMPRAEGETYARLKNGQRVSVRLSESDEWSSGVILAQLSSLAIDNRHLLVASEIPHDDYPS